MTPGILAGFLAACACFTGAGLGITRAGGVWRGTREIPAALPLALVVGVAGYAVVAQLALVLGASLALWQVIVVCVALAATGVVTRLPAIPRHPAGVHAWLLALALAMAGLLAVDMWFQPLWAYDAWAQWFPKARALVELDGLDAGWFTSAGPINRDYPIGFAAITAAVLRFTGVQPWTQDYLSLVLLAAAAAAAALLLAGRAGVRGTWIVIATIAVAPSFGIQVANGEVDIPLAALVATGALAGAIWLSTRERGLLVVAAVCLAGAATLKVEGVAYAAAVIVMLALLARPIRRIVAVVVVSVIALGAAVVPWFAWSESHSLERQGSASRVVDAGAVTDHGGMLPEIVARLTWELVDPSSWLLLPVLGLAAAAIVLARGSDRTTAVFALGVVGLCLAAMTLAYLTTPFDLSTHLDRSVRRVVTTPVLVLAFLTPLLISAAACTRSRRPLPADERP